VNEILIRDFDEHDRFYVQESWMRHYYKNSYFAKKIKPGIYYKNHELVIKHIMARPTIQKKIVCYKELSEVPLGFLVYDKTSPKNIIHFIYTKRAFRKFGLARILLESEKLDPNLCEFSHWTYDFDHLVHRFPDIIYNPYEV
jgi:hypothetical protein